MLDFLNSSKRIAHEVKEIFFNIQQAKEDVNKGGVKEAIEKLKRISSEESSIYRKIKRNKEGLALEVLENEIRKTMAIAKNIIVFLKRTNFAKALVWLDVLAERDFDVEKLIKERVEIREHDQMLSKNIELILREYIRQGMITIELFNGERSDILRALSNLVGKSGRVFGIDELNPFSNYKRMQMVNSLPNVELIKAVFPCFPAPNAEAIVVREFHYVFNSGNPKQCLKILISKIKKNGFLIIFLNHTEYCDELIYHKYSTAIYASQGKLKQIAFNEYELVFQKR